MRKLRRAARKEGPLSTADVLRLENIPSDLAPLDGALLRRNQRARHALWALAAAVFLGHSIMIGDAVFMVTQLVSIVAMAIIVVLARRFCNQICAAHARQLHVRE